MHTLDIVDGQMVVLDADGNGCDVQALTRYRDAKRQVQRWTWVYCIDVAEAYRKLYEFYSR